MSLLRSPPGWTLCHVQQQQQQYLCVATGEAFLVAWASCRTSLAPVGQQAAGRTALWSAQALGPRTLTDNLYQVRRIEGGGGAGSGPRRL